MPKRGRSIAPQLQTGNVYMKDYVLKEKPEPPSNEMVWAFDFGHPLRRERCPSLAGAGEMWQNELPARAK
jgi:hypothetical protein